MTNGSKSQKNSLSAMLSTTNSLKTECLSNNESQNDIKAPLAKIDKPYGLTRRLSTIACLTIAAILFILGLLSLRFTPFDLCMQERLQMRPGYPPFELWKTPKPEVICKIYIFTVTNGDEFLNGTDSKMKLKEFGPVIYREYLQHTDVVHNENSTMSYTTNHRLEFLPDRNRPGILNETVTVPNIVLLGMAARVASSPFMKIGFRLMSRADRVLVNTTVYNYLWNFTTPAFLSAQKIVPFMVHQDNGGAIYNIYNGFKDRINVRMGSKYGFKDFFTLDMYNGRPTVPGFEPQNGDCFATLQGASEGALYSSFLTKNTTLYYWRRAVCRPIPLVFEKEVMKGSLRAYKYVAKEDAYDRKENLTADCYSKTLDIDLPSGLSDVSRCYHDSPIAISFPHFYGRDGYWNNLLEGLTPCKEKHTSYTIIEPITGIPIEQTARSQSNMVLPKLSLFNENIEKMSGAVIPMVWIEYHQADLTPFIKGLLVFTVNMLPVLQYFISTFLLIGGGFYLWTGIKRLEFERKLRHANEPAM